ncbi:hypothetical protein H310_00796 [Aphanomyces invadans]|uniref:Uncharacterized protein n=1 Tax=Aphanomyces invadans TaxID=157072 RepID=A0A024UXU0_9STRA|nr:hypothetical protein H310_00796 [Aphanomyces invadans]ETW10508.1 hypothetical protein H310_00796 [Aphanomyces invadans]|eukprot:XP_008861919.1 hypothetical protein H310_00796 [Aphanomyces invadans]
MNASDSNASLLEMVHDMAIRLKQKKMDVEAIGCLEQALWLRWRLLGPQNVDVRRSLQEVVTLYNQHAMAVLGANDVDNCLDLLKKADQLASSDKFTFTESLRILTYNNLGCCYRRLGKLPKALKYLHAAAAIGAETTHVHNLSITFLNLCAIESQLGHHEAALEHAQSAILHAQDELVVDKVDVDDRLDVLDATTEEEKIVGLAIAYHNMAVELEHNQKADASLQWYKKALQMIFKYKTSNPDLWETFKATFDAAKHKCHRQPTLNGSPSKAGSMRVSSPQFTFENSRIAQGAPTPPAPGRQLHQSRSHHQPAPTTSFGAAQQVYQPSKPSTKPARPTSARPRPTLSKPTPLNTLALHHHATVATSPPKRTLKPRTSSKTHHHRPPAQRRTVEPPKVAPIFSQLRPKSARPSQRLRHAVQASRSPGDDDDDMVEVFEDGDGDDDDVLQVFDHVATQRVDVRRPGRPIQPAKLHAKPNSTQPREQARADAPNEMTMSPVPSERVSHLAYIKQLKHSVDPNVPPTNCLDITRRRKLALELERVQRVAALRLQALCRGHIVRTRTAAAHRDRLRSKELEAARLVQAKIRGGDRQSCLMKTRIELELARIHATAATRMQAVWRGANQRRHCQAHKGGVDGVPVAPLRTDSIPNRLVSTEGSSTECVDFTMDKARVAWERRRLLDATMERERLRQEANRLELARKHMEEATQVETKRLAVEAAKLEAEKRRLEQLADRLRLDEVRQADAQRQIEDAAKAENAAMKQRQVEFERANEEGRLAQAASVNAEANRRIVIEHVRQAAKQLDERAQREEAQRREDEANTAARFKDERLDAIAQTDEQMRDHEAAKIAVEVLTLSQASNPERLREIEAAQQMEAERPELEGLAKANAAARQAELEKPRQNDAVEALRIRWIHEAADAERLEAATAERTQHAALADTEATKVAAEKETVRLEDLANAGLIARQGADTEAKNESIQLDNEADDERTRLSKAAEVDRRQKELDKELQDKARAEADLVAAQTKEVRDMAAGVIQGVYKGGAARASVMALVARKLSRKYILQLHLNIEMNRALTIEMERIKSAVTIQQHARGMLCRKHLSSMSATQPPTQLLDNSTSNKSISPTYSQASFDSHKSTTLEPQYLDTQGPSCQEGDATHTTTILDAPELQEPLTHAPVDTLQLHVQVVAATAIQAIVRGHQSRLLVLAIRAGMDGAAGKIQRAVVRHQLCKRAADARPQPSTSTAYIARPPDTMACFPTGPTDASNDRRYEEHAAAVQKLAASVIQAAVRDGTSRRDSKLERAMAHRLAEACGDTIKRCWIDTDEQDMAKRLGAVTWTVLDLSRQNARELEMAKRLAHACVEKCVERHESQLHQAMAARLAGACWGAVRAKAIRRARHAPSLGHQQVDHARNSDKTHRDIVVASQGGIVDSRGSMEHPSNYADIAHGMAIDSMAATKADATVKLKAEAPLRADAPPKSTSEVDPVASMVRGMAATCIQAALKGYTTRRHYLALKEYMAASASDPSTRPSENAPDPSQDPLQETHRDTLHDVTVQHVAATYIQAAIKRYLVRAYHPLLACLGDPRPPGEEQAPTGHASTASLQVVAGVESPVAATPTHAAMTTSPRADSHTPSVTPGTPQADASPTSSGFSCQYSNSSFVSDKPPSEPSVHDSHSFLPAAPLPPSASQGSFIPSSASQGSFYSDIHDEARHDVDSAGGSLGDVLAATPATLAKYSVFVGALPTAPPPNDLDARALIALDLTFESFLEAFESAYDDISVAAAADALRVLAHNEPKWKTKAALERVAGLIEPKVHDRDLWTDEVNGCCMWLLHEWLGAADE